MSRTQTVADKEVEKVDLRDAHSKAKSIATPTTPEVEKPYEYEIGAIIRNNEHLAIQVERLKNITARFGVQTAESSEEKTKDVKENESASYLEHLDNLRHNRQSLQQKLEDLITALSDLG